MGSKDGANLANEEMIRLVGLFDQLWPAVSSAWMIVAK
jgi:hypothetical protein